MSTTSGGRENEMEKAQKAKPQQEESIFTQIIARKIPATILFEDERVSQLSIHRVIQSDFPIKVIAFRDTYPQAPVHFLVVPKKPIPSIADAQDEVSPKVMPLSCLSHWTFRMKAHLGPYCSLPGRLLFRRNWRMAIESSSTTDRLGVR